MQLLRLWLAIYLVTQIYLGVMTESNRKAIYSLLKKTCGMQANILQE